MVPVSRLLAVLDDVRDPRRARGKRYPLPNLLVFTVLALLSGARFYRGIITFLDQRREHLNRHFGVNLKRAPALNTLRHGLQTLDTADLEEVLRRHAQGLLPEPEQGEVKANQETLLDTIVEICAASSPLDAVRTKGRIRHGRHEHRLVETFDVTSRLGANWDGLIASVVRIERLTWHKDTKSGNRLKTNEIS